MAAEAGPQARILVLGDVRGQFKKLFARITKVNKAAGPFDAVFCVGTFFADVLDADPLGELQPYLSGNKKTACETSLVLRVPSSFPTLWVPQTIPGCLSPTRGLTPFDAVPIPTFFILGQESSQASLELLRARLPPGHSGYGPLCPNLEYLGQAGVREIHLKSSSANINENSSGNDSGGGASSASSSSGEGAAPLAVGGIMLRVAYLSGVFDPKAYDDRPEAPAVAIHVPIATSESSSEPLPPPKPVSSSPSSDGPSSHNDMADDRQQLEQEQEQDQKQQEQPPNQQSQTPSSTSSSSPSASTPLTTAINPYRLAYHSSDVARVAAQASQSHPDHLPVVDLLLTAEWGRGYHALLAENQLPADLNAPKAAGVLPVARLAAQVAARYHMAAGQNAFFALPPYITRTGGACRFYGLAGFANPQKRKDMFALALPVLPQRPGGGPGVEPAPEGSTPCPYLVALGGPSGQPQGVGMVRKSPSDDGDDDSLASSQSAKRMKLAPGGNGTGDRFSAELLSADAATSAGASHRWDIAGHQADLKRPPPRYLCRRCNQPGHWIKDCPKPRAPPEGYVCHKCNATGDHFIKECPALVQERQEKEQARKQQQQAGHESGAPPPEGYVCRKCNQSGHWIQRCPLVLAEQEQRASLGNPGSKSKVPKADYVCRKCQQGGHYLRDCPEFARQQVHARSKDCWFCLGTPTVESHLIVSIAEHMYMALAKGPLCPAHVLVMPIQHRASSLELTADEAEDLVRYKQAIRRWYAGQGCQALFYERYLPTRNAQHMHIQCIPVPDGNSVGDQIKDTIERMGAAASPEALEFARYPGGQAEFQEHLRKLGPVSQAPKEGGAGSSSLASLSTSAAGGGGDAFDAPISRAFIAFELLDGSVLAHLPETRRGDLFAFARNVSAELIGAPERANWKRCQMTVAEETEATDQLKNKFAPFDFVEDDGDGEDDDE